MDLDTERQVHSKKVTWRMAKKFVKVVIASQGVAATAAVAATRVAPLLATYQPDDVPAVALRQRAAIGHWIGIDGWMDEFSPSIEKAFDRVLWPFVSQLIFTSQVNQSMLSINCL